LPVKSVEELIALAKSQPGVLNFAAAAPGSSIYLAGELFKQMAGVDIVRVSYKGTGPAINDVIAGQVQMVFGTAPAVAPHVKSGRLKALGVTSATASALAPGLPTVAESGLPGYESGGIYITMAPAKTPAPIIHRLNAEIRRVLDQRDVKERFLAAGIESGASSPQELAATLKAENAKWSKVIREAGIRAK
jgi:tripartite-type tricarboxylate transporter receptor subunit TctC